MYGYSYAGIMQLWVASMRPKHLVAIGPGMPLADTYRDIGYPGGIPNVLFPPTWGAELNVDWALAYEDAVKIGDTQCLQNGVMHTLPNNLNTLAVQMLQHPTDDAWHYAHSAKNWTANINVPVFAVRDWQDEETGGRAAYYFNQLDPNKTWLLSTNGHHTMHQYSTYIIAQYESFYDYFLKGVNNGFGDTPRVQIWHETSASNLEPRSITTFPQLPVSVHAVPLFLGSNGMLTGQSNTEATGAQTSYTYPLPAPVVVDSTSQLDSSSTGGTTINTWTVAPDIALGRAVFTTPPLSNTVTTYGSSSADLWVSTTANDVDLQVTITEVRPDGQEEYIQRGWLRASHRALDPNLSTDLQPYHPHTAESLKDMTPGVPELLRVAMMPFSHVFRAGSSIRIYVEDPSVTGLWGFLPILTPQIVTILHDSAHPSKLMLGLLPKANVEANLPTCGNVDSEPCRSNMIPQPQGELDLH
jgi:putative CocE/NonD family hydrolase